MQNSKRSDVFIDMTPIGVKYAICTDWFQAIMSTSEPFVFDVVDPLAIERKEKFTEAINKTSEILNGDMWEITGQPEPNPELIPDKTPKKIFVPLEEYSFFEGEIVLKKMNHSAPQFRFGYEIIYKRKSFGRIHVIPSSGYCFMENEMQFELNNNVHYEQGWVEDLKYIMKKLKWSMVNISRLDIALDGWGFYEIYDLYASGIIQKIGKSDVTERRTSKRILKTFYIGSRKSDKYITCYDKTKELNDKGHKDYIRKYWERSGLDVERVQRMELRLSNEAIKLIKDFNWERLGDFEYLASLMRSTCEGGFYLTEQKIRKGKVIPSKMKFSAGLLDFIEVTGDTNVTRNIENGKRIRFVNWDYIGGVKLERLTTKEANEIYSMRITSKAMARIYFSTGNDMYLHLAHEVAVNSNNLEWLNLRWDRWKKDYENRKENKLFEYLPKYQMLELTKSRTLMENSPLLPCVPDLFFVRS